MRLLVVIVFALSTAASALVASADARRVKDQLDSFFAAGELQPPLNGAATVARDGVVIFAGAYGYADFAKKVRLSSGRVFQTASMAKPVTALSVLQLHEAGILDIEAPVTRFLPDFRLQRSRCGSC